MALPNNTSKLDTVTNTMIPAATGDWLDLSDQTWATWQDWQVGRADNMTVLGQVTDRGVEGYFNLQITADVTGNISYGIYTSNTGAFAGEETLTTVEPNTSNISAFYGRYFVVAANVSGTSGLQLRKLDFISSNQRFDIQFNDVSTDALSTYPGDDNSRVLPLTRTIGAVTNMQVTAHNPTAQNSIYITSGETGYVVNRSGPSTTLTNVLSSIGPVVQYLAVTAEGFTANTVNSGLKIYKTTDGDSWNEITAPANVATNGRHVDWSPDGTRLAAVFNGNASASFRWYSRSGDTLTKLDDPDQWASTPRRVAWSPAGDYIAVAQQYSPYLVLYSRSSNNLSKATDPATLPTGLAYDVAWSPDGTYLAVAHVSSPYVTIYKRSGNTFTKLANPSILVQSGVTAASSVAWSPDGTYLAVGSESTGGTETIKFYYRSGDTFTMLTAANVTVAGTGAIYSLQWNPQGTHLAAGWLSDSTQSWQIYRQSGNTWTSTSTSVSGAYGGTWGGVEWSPSGYHLFTAIYQTSTYLNKPRGLTAYDVSYSGTANANVTLTKLTGVTSNVGNITGISSLTTSYISSISVANAAIFSGSGGNIRIDSESLSYQTANVTSNQLELITRGITTAEFGNSTANIHAIGAEVFPIEQLDTTARYFETQAAGVVMAYVGEKDRVQPSIIMRDSDGNYVNGIVDAVVWALPEQYMDDTNLNIR